MGTNDPGEKWSPREMEHLGSEGLEQLSDRELSELRRERWAILWRVSVYQHSSQASEAIIRLIDIEMERRNTTRALRVAKISAVLSAVAVIVAALSVIVSTV